MLSFFPRDVLDEILNFIESVSEGFPSYSFIESVSEAFPTYSYIQSPNRVVLGLAYRGLTGGFLLLQNFSVAISVSPHVCFILVLIFISMFLR